MILAQEKLEKVDFVVICGVNFFGTFGRERFVIEMLDCNWSKHFANTNLTDASILAMLSEIITSCVPSR